jgi:hypothetical protein
MLVYRAGSEGKSQLLWLDRTGKVIDASCPPGAYSNLSLEPDGKRPRWTILVGVDAVRSLAAGLPARSLVAAHVFGYRVLARVRAGR